ncbi:XRE family transcriptional regulator [Psychrobacillus sp.]|uniref:helix-turn-helix domain-containing protein n=1 Tax=Psychrobacillus sp. TaxID=1871623 RepID=UPI0028BF5660|nr:XRE family transcriptional regulator [Psychrobacillus sp.]
MSLDSVGQVLKSLRKERKLTLKTLAEQTNVSISFLSQVERGKSSVTLESLKKIADALAVNPSVFFSAEHTQDDLEIRRQKFHYQDLSNGISDAFYSPILVTLQPGESEGDAFSHSGHEFLFVLEGSLTVLIDGVKEDFSAQQSIMFDATKDHYWYNLTDQPVRFLVVSSK